MNQSRSFLASRSRWVFVVMALLSATTLECNSATDDTVGSAAGISQKNWKVLNFQYQAQSTGYWCGPAATRIALSTRLVPPDQQTLARQLGTTTNGTDSISQVRDVLNQRLGSVYDVRTFYRDDDALPSEQADRFWDEIVQSIENGYPVVTNIVATPNNRPPGYPNDWIYHYVVVVGYNPQNMQVYVADSARFSGIEQYWIDFGKMTRLVARRGYAYWVQQGTRCPGSAGLVHGAIEQKYQWLGACNSFLGAPTGDEIEAPDGVGRYSVFQNGSIYWTEDTGAFEVHGAIRDEWKDTGWEAGSLGYPTTDELATPDGKGRYNKFQKGAIYYTSETGAHGVYGRILEKWAELDYEKGKLGYPIKSEYDDGGQRRSDFQSGSIKWDPATDAFTVTTTK